jgi:uncharacterized membrane protein YgaE (UPF0421/DUF939 family)
VSFHLSMQRLLSSCIEINAILYGLFVFILEFGSSFITIATMILLTLLCCMMSLCARVVFLG